MLSVPRSQNGNAYRQWFAVRFSSVQRPANRAGGALPHFLRTHVGEDGSQRSDPAAAAHRHMVGDAGPHADLAAALEVNRANVQLLPHPPRHGQVGSGLDGDIVLDGEEVQRPGELHGVRAVNVLAHGRSEPRSTHAMSGALRNIVFSGRRTESSSRPIHQVRRCIRLHLGYTPGVTPFLWT